VARRNSPVITGVTGSGIIMVVTAGDIAIVIITIRAGAANLDTAILPRRDPERGSSHHRWIFFEVPLGIKLIKRTKHG